MPCRKQGASEKDEPPNRVPPDIYGYFTSNVVKYSLNTKIIINIMQNILQNKKNKVNSTCKTLIE